MRKYSKIISRTVMCISATLILGFIWNASVIKADEESAEEPTAVMVDYIEAIDVNDLEIVGSDRIFAFENEVEFTLRAKKGSNARKRMKKFQKYSDIDYGNGNIYKWSSTNKSVAKFKETLKVIPSNSCLRMEYKTLDRPAIFKVKPGTATIQCKINGGPGNKITLTKKIKVLKGTPLKKVQIGKYKLSKEQRYTTETELYANDQDKNTKVKVKAKKGWKVKRISVDTNANGMYKNITESKKFSLKTDYDVFVKVQLQHKKTGSIFTYCVDIRRYEEHKLWIGNYFREGYGLVCRKTAWDVPLIPRYTVVLRYKKDSKAKDEYSFKSTEDLLYKLKKYWGYSDQTVSIKNGMMTYKEAFGLEPWTYCTSNYSINATVKKLEDEW